MYYIGTVHVLDGRLTLGSLLVFSAYILMLYRPAGTTRLTPRGPWKAPPPGRSVASRFSIARTTSPTLPTQRNCWQPLGCDSFRRLSRSDIKDERAILHDIDLRISPNQIVAIVGGTGAGKSTLLSLVPRFYDPSSGSVTLDGQDFEADHQEISARTDRNRPAGYPAFFNDHPAKTSPTDGRARPRTKSSPRPNRLRPTILFADCLTAMRARSANAAVISALGSDSESGSRERFSRMRLSSFWMSRRQRSIRPLSRLSCPRSRNS